MGAKSLFPIFFSLTATNILTVIRTFNSPGKLLHNWISYTSNQSKQIQETTGLIAPAHNIRDKVWMKNYIHGFTDNIIYGFTWGSNYAQLKDATLDLIKILETTFYVISTD